MKNNNHESHSLKVSEAKQRDVGKARARIGRKKMISLGLKSGDIIEIKGKRTTAATIWQSDSNNEDSESMEIPFSVILPLADNRLILLPISINPFS